MRVRRGILLSLWLLWTLACLVSFVLEVESPFYADAISWVYWGPETEIGWRSSSLVRWGVYHLALVLAPVLVLRGVRRLRR